MYVLDALKGPTRNSSVSTEASEFRLLCSGTLYNGRVQASDWTKSIKCRDLLSTPVTLFVASASSDEYPQELMLRIKVSYTRKEYPHPNGNTTIIFYPHSEVANDLAALLTLLLRRLVTVYTQVNCAPTEGGLASLGVTLDALPVPVSRFTSGGAWRSRPPIFINHPDRPTQIVGYSVAPLGVDTDWLAQVLNALPSMSGAPTIIGCARLYAQAMQIIEDRPNIAYQLFIAAAEALSGIAMADYQPTDDEKVEMKTNIRKRAQQLGVSDAGARELAILATAGDRWSGRRFRECLKRYTDDTIWTKDDVFIQIDEILPKPDKLDAALKDIYKRRGAVLHSAQDLPLTAALGTSSEIPVTAMGEIRSGDAFPPVTWFERVVQKSIVTYLEKMLGIPAARPPV